MDLKDILILIIDDNFASDDPLIVDINEEFKEGIVMQPKEAIGFIKKNLSSPIIILLDISMPHHLNGHETLDEIRKKTYSIPVILFSAIEEREEIFSDFINNKVVGFIRKDTGTENIINKLKEVALEYSLKLDYVIENWIKNQPEEIRKKPFMRISDGRVLNYEELLHEIRLDTEIGKKMKRDIKNLAVDLFPTPNNDE